MAFSLETAIVIPLAIGSWLGLLLAAAPAYEAAHHAARSEVLALTESLSADSIYRHEPVNSHTQYTPSLVTSPQRVLEISSLIADDTRLLTQAFSAWRDSPGHQGIKP